MILSGSIFITKKIIFTELFSIKPKYAGLIEPYCAIK